jgi:membrane fusion protein (multidrug efflux system)
MHLNRPEDAPGVRPAAPGDSTPTDSIFRTPALRHRQSRRSDEGFALKVAPPWLDSAYRLVLVIALAGLAALALAPASEYASGPAVVRLAQRSEVASRSSGTVAEVFVTAGERVVAGQLLGRIDGALASAEAERLRRELDLLLVERLRSPRVDRGSQLGAVREQLRAAELALEQLSFRAPRDGVVGDVLLRPGKAIEPGQLAFTVVAPSAPGRPTVLGLLPGRYRPLLRPEMPLRLTLSGYRMGRQQLVVEHVSASVVGAVELRVIAGNAAPDVGAAGDGWVLIRAPLLSRHFEASGRRYEYYDGLTGTVEVAVRRRKLISVLSPFWSDSPSGG